MKKKNIKIRVMTHGNEAHPNTLNNKTEARRIIKKYTETGVCYCLVIPFKSQSDAKYAFKLINSGFIKDKKDLLNLNVDNIYMALQEEDIKKFVDLCSKKELIRKL